MRLTVSSTTALASDLKTARQFLASKTENVLGIGSENFFAVLFGNDGLD
jgi:hypothetical protein